MPSVARRAKSPFASKKFLTYFIGQSTSFFGDGIVPMTFAFAALAVSDSGWGMPTVLLSLWGARLLFVALGGDIADRYDRARVMWLADVVRLFAQIIPIVAFITDSATLWHLGVSAALYGVGNAFFVPATVGLLPELVPQNTLQKANAWIDVARNTGMLVGPALATLLVTVGGVQTALLFDVVTFIVSLVCLSLVVRLRVPQLKSGGDHIADHAEPSEQIETGFWNGVRTLKRYPVLLALILMWCPVQLSVASINVLGPIVARDSLGGIAYWAALATALAAGGLIGAFVAGWLKLRRPELYVLVVLSFCQPVQLVLFGLGVHIVALTVTFGITAVLVAIGGVVYDTYIQTTVPDQALARIGAVEDTLMSVMVPIGLAISVPLAKLLGTSNYLYTLAGLIICSGLVTAITIATHRTQTTVRKTA